MKNKTNTLLNKDFETIKSNLFSHNKPMVLYVQTSLYENSNYIALYEPFSDNHYWRLNKAVIDVLAKYTEWATIVVKLHPTPYRKTYLSVQYARDKGYRGIHFIKDECHFTDLLPYASLVIIDFPSTVLLQALCFEVPLIILDKWIRLDEGALKSLKKRAMVRHKIDEFLKAIDDYMHWGYHFTDTLFPHPKGKQWTEIDPEEVKRQWNI